jgi:thiol-disulfide isomerase/thioredoxin
MKLLVAVFLLFATANAAELPGGLLKLDGRAAPALELKDMDGRTTDLVKLRGQWVMVHFWASWCGPCRKEMPTIQSLAGKIPPDRLRIVLVNTAESDEAAFSFLAIVAPEIETLMDRDGAVTDKWQPRGLPSTFLVDPDGRLRFLALGGRVWDQDPFLGFLRQLK